jgi:hypothetical protein
MAGPLIGLDSADGKSMKRTVTLAIICCAMAINLVAQQPYEGTTLPGLAEQLAPLHGVVSDSARSNQERDAAMVKIFEKSLQSGFDSGEIISVMKGASWLKQAVIRECFGVGRMVQIVPSCSNVKQDKTFQLALYSGCAIEFRLRGTQPDGSQPEAETVLEFLKGREDLILNAVVTELAIFSPRADQKPGLHVVHYDAQGRRVFDMPW